MTTITVNDAGTPRTITDIALYVAERDEIVVKLERIYATYDKRPEGALDRHEELIVMLVNRYHQLSDWIARYDEVTTRRSNIAAGRALLEAIGKGQP